MPRRKTILLALLLLASMLAVGLAWLRLSKFREDAATARENLVIGRTLIADIRRWKSSPGRAAPVSADAPELTRHLRAAATAAGLTDVPGTETEAPKRVGNTDYSELTLDLRFEPLTLRQLTTFLHTLAQIDPSSRATAIELRPPDQAGAIKQSQEELWMADVAVGYLTYTPQKVGK
jgi:hypothetical protein